MPGRHFDMWLDGSDIRFMRCTLPEIKYMFHALYSHVSDRTRGNAIAYIIYNPKNIGKGLGNIQHTADV